MDTLVVIPTYNEAANLPQLVRRIFSLEIPDLAVLFVDDNSPDGTADIAQALEVEWPGRIHVLRRRNKDGLGRAYIAGFQEAMRLRPTNVVQMDADLSHPPEYIPTLLESLNHCDVAVGSRYIQGGGATEDWGTFRHLLSQGGDFYVRTVLGMHTRDSKSGFKAFRGVVLDSMDFTRIHSKGYIFQAEFLYLCNKLGYSVTEIPFVFQNRTAGRSKLSVQIIVEALWRPILIRWLSRTHW
ncbi:MAG: polyprenol monophosphomannose synthase [Chloroflexota bacterium]|nr:polyprenol monophosphomannose synthase [Chloroflexota bacterium]